MDGFLFSSIWFLTWPRNPIKQWPDSFECPFTEKKIPELPGTFDNEIQAIQITPINQYFLNAFNISFN
jgi:hypothetical protein